MEQITSAVIISMLFFVSLWLYVQAQSPPQQPLEQMVKAYP